MDTIYNILHLTGAFCLIVFSVTGFALIIRWWNRLSVLYKRVKFLYDREALKGNPGPELIFPFRSVNDETVGAGIKTENGYNEILKGKDSERYLTGSGATEPKGVVTKINARSKKPPPPLPPPPPPRSNDTLN